MKKSFSFLLSVVMVIGIITSVPIAVNATSVENLTFEINEEGTMYKIVKCSSEVSGDLVIPSTYKGLPVTRIDAHAFSGAYAIDSINIPSSIKSVGNNAFCMNSLRLPELRAVYITDIVSWCNVDFGNSEYVHSTANNPLEIAKNLYLNGELVTEIEIPGTVSKIKNDVFCGCESLENVEILNGVTSIGACAFHNCSMLSKVTIPDSVISIGGSAFEGCENLETITLPDNIKSIGFRAFCNCSMLSKVTIPDSVTSIGVSAFAGCENLETITLPNNIESVGSRAFYDCGITSVYIPNSVKKIESEAFGYKYDSWLCTTEPIEDFKIYGTKGSVSEIYAKENGFTFIETECKQHVSSDWIIDKAATANATGSQHKECTVCGEILETAVIPQLKPATPKLSKVQSTASGVKVTWGKVTGADNYVVYRKAYDAKAKKWGGWTNLGKTTSASYVDKAAKSGTYYLYTVRANNEAGLSGYNTSGIKIYFLGTPKISSTANASNAITVKWAKITGATGYIVYRKEGSGGWKNLGKTTGTSFTDKTAKAGVTYKYTVKAYYSSYVSAYNTSGTAIRRLTTPTLKSVTSAKAGVTFKWNKVTGATGYYVYRKTGNGSWVKLATVTGNSKITYLDKTAKKGVTYKYTVKAYYGTSTSAYNTKGLTIKDKY